MKTFNNSPKPRIKIEQPKQKIIIEPPSEDSFQLPEDTLNIDVPPIEITSPLSFEENPPASSEKTTTQTTTSTSSSQTSSAASAASLAFDFNAAKMLKLEESLLSPPEVSVPKISKKMKLRSSAPFFSDVDFVDVLVKEVRFAAPDLSKISKELEKNISALRRVKLDL